MGSLIQQYKAFWSNNRIPASGIFELTPRCNLNCKMCYIHLTPEQMGGNTELSTEQWLRIAEEAVENGLVKVLLTGGECTLHPGFLDIYSFLKKIGTIVSLNTNGTRIHDDILNCFREQPPNQINISLYGSDEYQYEKNTGKKEFERVIHNIDSLCEIGIRPRISVTVSKNNADDIGALLDLISKKKLSYRIDMNLIDARADTGRQYEDYALSPEEIIRKSYEIMERQGLKRRNNSAITFEPVILPADESYHDISCSAGKWHYAIRWDGQMAACFELPIPGLYVQQSGFKKAWEETGLYMKSFSAPIECKTCSLRKECVHCVALRRNPKNPGHCNLERCKITYAKYNAGVSGFMHFDSRTTEEC